MVINGKRRYIASQSSVMETSFVPVGLTGEYDLQTSFVKDAKFPPREYYTLEYLMQIGTPLNEIPLTPLTPPSFSVENLVANLNINSND